MNGVNMNWMNKSLWLVALAVSSVASIASATSIYHCTDSNNSGATLDARPINPAPNNILYPNAFPPSNPPNTNCDVSSPVTTIGCWTGNTDNFYAPDSVTWAQAQLRTCNNVKQWRVYAFGTLASHFPFGSSFGSVKAEVDVFGNVGGTPLLTKLDHLEDTSADGHWSDWKNIALSSSPSLFQVWGSYTYTP